jgi:hypothetical protein
MIHLLLYAWLGGFFAWCAQGRLRADGIWAQPAITIVGVFTGVIVAPTTLYLNIMFPDWSWLYLVDSDRVPWLAIIPVIAASAGALVASYYACARVIRADRTRYVLGGLVGGLVFLAVVITIASGRLFPALSDDKFVLIILVTLTIGVLAAAAYVGWELWKDGKRATAR